MKRRKKPRAIEAYIVASLRKIWYYSRLRKDAYNAAKVGDKLRCAMCAQLFEKIQIDHIDQVGSPKNDDGTYDWNRYIKRLLFCLPDNLQALCKTCHHAKNILERSYSDKMKKKLKKDLTSVVKKSKVKK